MEIYHNVDELKYFNKTYCFNNTLCVPLILNQISKFLDKDKIKCLCLCNKDIYQKYFKQVEKLKINKEVENPNLKALIDKYDNINNLDLSYCKNIKDFTPISKLQRLEILNVNKTYISDISFLEKNKNIKELNLDSCENIKDFTPISKFERLEKLDVSETNISENSFLEKNKNIKELNFKFC